MGEVSLKGEEEGGQRVVQRAGRSAWLSRELSEVGVFWEVGFAEGAQGGAISSQSFGMCLL